jgi:hypothetical protein
MEKIQKKTIFFKLKHTLLAHNSQKKEKKIFLQKKYYRNDKT